MRLFFSFHERPRPQHAYASEHLLPYIKPGARILDVGSGSGYLTAVLYHLASEDPSRPGKVVGIEHVPELVQFSLENLKKDGLGDALENKAIEVIVGDGRQGNSILQKSNAGY